MIYKNTTLVILWLIGLLFFVNSTVLATSVDRMALVNIEGYAGKTINQEIKLEGTDPQERSGFWYTHYKEKEGDSAKMDITSWIVIEPEDYTIKQGEIKSFIVNIEIPKDTKPGLYGAASIEAGQEGHSDERRTYIVFKDALGGGNVYSGLLIPVSVKVLSNPNPLLGLFNLIKHNILAIVLFTIIIVMGIMLLRKKKKIITQ